MSFDFNTYSDERKYDVLKAVVKEMQKRDGNTNDTDYSFKEEDGLVNLVGVRGFSQGKPCESTNKVFDDTMFVVFKKNGEKTGRRI